jgi:sugar transferase EpsL
MKDSIRKGGLVVKRLFDVVAATVLLLASVPALLVIALLIKVNMGSPVLFRQERPGLGGRPFRIIKFRTMTAGLDRNGKLLPDGQRITALGERLRAMSLDELPELVNVLAGDMSMVGPRPLLMEYLPHYDAQQARRHEVRPGITGLAQINGRNATDWQTRFAWDVEYVERRSLWMDIRILARTVVEVFHRRGINSPGHSTMPLFRGMNDPSEQPQS